MDKDKLNKKIPEIYCAISIYFEHTVDIDSFLFDLNRIGISDGKVCRPKCESSISVDIAIVKNEHFWYLDDALKKMFSKICDIKELKNVVKEYNGTFSIDIAFYQYDTAPALEFIGENMKKIHFLEADVSIDPYIL